LTVKQQVLDLMQPGVKLTADEIAGALDLPVLSVRPRVCEMFHAKVIKKAGTKNNRKGNPMTQWERDLGR